MPRPDKPGQPASLTNKAGKKSQRVRLVPPTFRRQGVSESPDNILPADEKTGETTTPTRAPAPEVVDAVALANIQAAQKKGTEKRDRRSKDVSVQYASSMGPRKGLTHRRRLYWIYGCLIGATIPELASLLISNSTSPTVTALLTTFALVSLFFLRCSSKDDHRDKKILYRFYGLIAGAGTQFLSVLIANHTLFHTSWR
jgi:hypothetical protein